MRAKSINNVTLNPQQIDEKLFTGFGLYKYRSMISTEKTIYDNWYVRVKISGSYVPTPIKIVLHAPYCNRNSISNITIFHNNKFLIEQGTYNSSNILSVATAGTVTPNQYLYIQLDGALIETQSIPSLYVYCNYVIRTEIIEKPDINFIPIFRGNGECGLICNNCIYVNGDITNVNNSDSFVKKSQISEIVQEELNKINYENSMQLIDNQQLGGGGNSKLDFLNIHKKGELQYDSKEYQICSSPLCNKTNWLQWRFKRYKRKWILSNFNRSNKFTRNGLTAFSNRLLSNRFVLEFAHTQYQLLIARIADGKSKIYFREYHFNSSGWTQWELIQDV